MLHFYLKIEIMYRLPLDHIYFLTFIINQLNIIKNARNKILNFTLILLYEKIIYQKKLNIIYPLWAENIIENFLILPKITQNVLYNQYFPPEIFGYINKIYLLYEQLSIHPQNICPCDIKYCLFKWFDMIGNTNLKINQQFYHCGIKNCHMIYFGFDLNNSTYCDYCDKDCCYVCAEKYTFDGITKCDDCK